VCYGLQINEACHTQKKEKERKEKRDKERERQRERKREREGGENHTQQYIP